MSKNAIFIAAITMLVGTSAFAADMAVKAPPAPVASNWAGFYAGVNAGYAWGRTTATDELASNGLCWVVCGATFSAHTSGFTGGGQAGYNWQTGSAVYGVEADLGYLGLRGTGPYLLTANTFVHTNGGVFATVRGRLGVATSNNWLLYVTGGYFGADLDSTVGTNSAPGAQLLNMSNTGFQSGWTAGGGVEYALMKRWSIKAEYLYYDVGKKNVGGNFTGGGANVQFFGINNIGNLARLGLNYHFN